MRLRLFRKSSSSHQFRKKLAATQHFGDVGNTPQALSERMCSCHVRVGLFRLSQGLQQEALLNGCT